MFTAIDTQGKGLQSVYHWLYPSCWNNGGQVPKCGAAPPGDPDQTAQILWAEPDLYQWNHGGKENALVHFGPPGGGSAGV